MGKSLRVVTARVFFVLSRFFYFHPQCQGRRHFRFTFYEICEPRGAHPLLIDLLFFFILIGCGCLDSQFAHIDWCATYDIVLIYIYIYIYIYICSRVN